MTTQARVDYVLAEGMEGRYWVWWWDKFVEVKGVPVSLTTFPEMDAFAYQHQGLWLVAVAASGQSIYPDAIHAMQGMGSASIDLAVVAADKRFADEDIQHVLNTLQKRLEHGLSPRYTVAPWETGEEE